MAAARARDRNSAGQILRLLRDSKLLHIETAIAGVRRVRTGVRSESLLKASSAGDVDARERANEGRVLSLSDHKQIASLQVAFNTVANAYDDDQDERGKHYNRNLVCAVAGAAMMQSMRDCTASRMNCCIWGPQVEKYHVFLDWMMSYELKKERTSVGSCGYMRQLLLGWIQPTTEKQKQLAACLTLFELLQRRRRKLETLEFQSETLCLLATQFDAYVDALREIVDRGTFPSADLHRVIPSKLALIALETLGLLCGDVAMHFATLDKVAKTSFLVAQRLMRKVVQSMRFFLDMLHQWHAHSRRRQFLIFALQHLQSYVFTCDTVLLSVNVVNGDYTIANSRGILDVLCWHWVTTVSILCTRADAYLRKQKLRPSKFLAQILTKWSYRFITFDENVDCNNASGNPEIIYAQVRYVCVLLDSIGGAKGFLTALNNFFAEAKVKLVFFFVQSLATATMNGHNATTRICVNVLRAILLPGDSINILSSQDEEQNLLSQLLYLNGDSLLSRGNSSSELEIQIELEVFIAEFVISRRLFITELLWGLHETNTSSLLNALSLVRTFLYQLDRSAALIPLHRQWRIQLTQGVSDLITHENHRIRRLAYSCLPSLDAVFCIANLTAVGIHEAENHAVSSALNYLFKVSTWSSLEAIVTWSIDACQYSSLKVHLLSSNAPASPHDWSDFAIRLGERNDGKQIELQSKLISFSFGLAGERHVKSTQARQVVLRVLLRKFFGSPRDPVLLRMLRELTVSGWVGSEEFEAMATQICSRMMNAMRLTEQLLDSDLPSATNAVKNLLFSRLAPLLVLRMLPRIFFGMNCLKKLPCGREDLNHLNEYIDRQLQLEDSYPEANSCTTREVLFHILARLIVDPLEYKEIKVLAVECLSIFPSSLMLPFVLAYVVAFLREAFPHNSRDSSLIVTDNSIPNSCGLVTAKLMVYYLNRVFSGDEDIYANCDASSKAIALFVQILAIPSDHLLLTDLKHGCIDCMALILFKLAAINSTLDNKEAFSASASALMNLFIFWIFGSQNDKECFEASDANAINSRVVELLETMWSEARRDKLPLQVRICCCNVLLSAMSRSEHSVLTRWKAQGLISRIALATQSCPEDKITAGSFQIIHHFMHKVSNQLSTQDNGDVQLARICFETTVGHLESTRSQSVAMNGLKVIEVLLVFVETLQRRKREQLDRCLITLRDRRISPDVTKLARSLLQAITETRLAIRIC